MRKNGNRMDLAVTKSKVFVALSSRPWSYELNTLYLNSFYLPQPVTKLHVGVDSKNHATPFAVLISQDVQANTLSIFLNSWRRTQPPDRTPDEALAITKAAQEVVSGTWRPAFFMIDKDQAERIACKKVFPDVQVRVCQWHAMEAIRCWLRAGHAVPNAKSGSKRTTKKHIVPEEAHIAIQHAFRPTQRCRQAQEFSTACTGFELAIEAICKEHNIPEQFEIIRNYFQKNLWCTEWQDSITDIGLPDGYTRDKILNTNKYAEAFIKTIKSTILGMQRNKRVDTLVIIVADVMLPYYCIWRDNHIRHAKDHIDITHLGYTFWSTDCIQVLDNNKFQVNVFAETKQRRYKVSLGAHPSCTCSSHVETGRACGHIWGALLLDKHGNFRVWADETNPRMNEKALKIQDIQRQAEDVDGVWDDDDLIDIQSAVVVFSWWSQLSTVFCGHSLWLVWASNQIPHAHHTTSTNKESRKSSRAQKSKTATTSASEQSLAKPTTKVATAAPEDDEDAQAVEDLERLESNFDTWDDKWYTMRIEEANLISDMLVQLSRQLGLGAVVLADQGTNMKHLLDQVDWSRIVCCQDIVKNNPLDSALVELINSAPDASTLKHVVFIFHQHAHWSLIHFNISTKAVYLIDSLPNLGAQRVTSDQLEIYSKLANILSTNHQEPLANHSTWHLSTIYTGHQPYSQENGIVLNLSCGFWSLFYALLTVLGAPIQQSLARIDVVNALWNLLLGYLDQHTGGLTQNVFIANLTEFIPNLRARFLQYAHMELWGPHQFNSTRTQAVVPDPNHSNNHPGSQTAQLIPRPLTHEEHLVIIAGERLSAKGRAVLVILSSIRNTIPLEHTLEFPKANSTNNQQKGIWCHLTSLMPLLKDSPSRVSKLNPFGQKQKTSISIFSDIAVIFVPFNEPIISASQMPVLQHYRVNMDPIGQQSQYIHREKSHAVEAVELVKTYLSNTSNGRKADKGQYNEKEWSFTIVSNTPQQSNTMDCGIFMLGYLMKPALDQALSWTQEQIAVFRARLAFQIQHGQVALHHLVIQAPSPHNNPTQQHYVNVMPKPLCESLQYSGSALHVAHRVYTLFIGIAAHLRVDDLHTVLSHCAVSFGSPNVHGF
ncbi:hypothetical protein BDV93DRAFT_514236 [Ceratobasidium sp. AG-I]|nr:hypothetical protein BDV93DRAFT_514236 [Ceratobasidium sp. AG-I]